MNDILEANLENLKKIYGAYITSHKRHLIYEDILNIFVKQTDLGVAEKDILFSWGMSKMAITNEPL